MAYPSVYDANPVKNMTDPVHRLRVEDRCLVIALDDVLLQSSAPDHGKDVREKSEYGRATGLLRHARASGCQVFSKGDVG